MLIQQVESFAVPPRWLLVKVATDEGVCGWGEATLEGHVKEVAAAIDQFAAYLAGRDPRRIEDHWQVLTKGGFYRGGPVLSSAVAGIDQALWDILGKSLGVPVYTLLGGPVRDRLRTYAWVGGDDFSRLTEQVEERLGQGFAAVKMNVSGRMDPVTTPDAVRRAVGRAEEVRRAIGDERDFAIDFHGRVSLPAAPRLLAALEPTSPLFIEEPMVPELTSEVGRLVSASQVPIALGERLYSRWQFREPLEAGVAVVQPDLSHAGGISEVRRIAVLAEMYGAWLAPHCPLGPVALAACIQVDFASPNFLIQEHGAGIHYNRDADVFDYLLDAAPLRCENGYIELPSGPGLGIVIDEKQVRRASEKFDGTPRLPWRHPDGGFAEY